MIEYLEGSSFQYILSSIDNCNVEYYLAIFSENEPSTDTCDGYKDISHCFPFIINVSSVIIDHGM